MNSRYIRLVGEAPAVLYIFLHPLASLTEVTVIATLILKAILSCYVSRTSQSKREPYGAAVLFKWSDELLSLFGPDALVHQ